MASENLLSERARQLLASDLGHRYCIPEDRPPALWEYPDQAQARKLQAIAEELACELFRGSVADVRPLSGNNAATILLACGVGRGETVASVPANCGGHFATSALCGHFGVNHVELPYCADEGCLDVERAVKACVANEVDLIMLDASMQLFPHPLRELREGVPDHVPIVYDASHTMGLIAGGEFQAPLDEGADMLQGSTHKSLFGPQKGLFVFKEAGPLTTRIQEGVTPLFVSNLHLHHVAALALALAECQAFGKDYAARVVRNARILASRLFEQGCDVLFPEREFTRSHQLLWAVGEEGETARGFERLEAVGLHVNPIRVPFRRGESGFRLGVAELTRRGLGDFEFSEIADLLVKTVRGEPATAIRERVAALAGRFRSIGYTFDHEDPAPWKVARSAH